MGTRISLILSLGIIAAVSACSPNPTRSNDSEVKIVNESLADIDLLRSGTFSFSEYEYDSGAFVDDDVLESSATSRIKTDIRGRLYLPAGDGPYPLVVLLHGNHGTCGLATGAGNPRLDISVEFAIKGSCPSGYTETPSYRGYDAAARLLASWGYAVTSINANRGITGRDTGDSFDSSLIYARGNLVLRHIEELYKWSRDGKSTLLKANGLDLTNKLNIAKVGLMGHSRGGEGVRYAYNIYQNGNMASKWQTRIPGLKIQGIFEIGPVDMGTNNGRDKVEARGVAWNVLIPGCDGDVSDFSGVRPFERMESSKDDGFPKSVFTLWGANHNFFNSEWQVSDAAHSCVGSQEPLWNTKAPPMPSAYASIDDNARATLTGSSAQIKFEEALMLAFFHAHLGPGKMLEWDHIFDPQYRLPTQLSSLAESSREYFVASDSKSVFYPDRFAADTPEFPGLEVSSLKNHLNHEIAAMSEYLAEHNPGYKATLSRASFVRSAIVIKDEDVNPNLAFDSGPAIRTATLPLAPGTSAQGFWTLDVALAAQKGCHSFDSSLDLNCEPSDLDESFEIALVLANGRVTRSVNIQNYIELNDWYANYFEKQGRQGSGSGPTQIIFKYVPVIFQTARFELSDFGVTNEAIKSVQITFKSGKDVSLIVESMRLTKGPR